MRTWRCYFEHNGTSRGLTAKAKTIALNTSSAARSDAIGGTAKKCSKFEIIWRSQVIWTKLKTKERRNWKLEFAMVHRNTHFRMRNVLIFNTISSSVDASFGPNDHHMNAYAHFTNGGNFPA
jgi:hypothetical protein